MFFGDNWNIQETIIRESWGVSEAGKKATKLWENLEEIELHSPFKFNLESQLGKQLQEVKTSLWRFVEAEELQWKRPPPPNIHKDA